MGKIKVVVAALDLESTTEAVFARASQLAAAHTARLMLVHVIKDELASPAAVHLNEKGHDLRQRLQQHALEKMSQLAKTSMHSCNIDFLVKFGVPHQEVTQIARESNASLVLIGPGQARSLKEKVLGSTADRIVRQAHVPVLLVKKSSSEPYRTIISAIDFSILSEQAMRFARDLVPEARLQLVHAIEIPLNFEDAMLRVGTSQAEIEQYRLATARKAREKLTAFALKATDSSKVPLRIIDGEASTALVHFSKKAGNGLLSIGSHSRNIVVDTLLGSVAQRVLRQAACDVLIAGMDS